MKKYTVKYTAQFKKDYTTAIKRGLKMELLHHPSDPDVQQICALHGHISTHPKAV